MRYIIAKICEDSFVEWCIQNEENAIDAFYFDKDTVEKLWSEGLMGGEDEIAGYERGGTPWCISYTFMPDELKAILSRCGVTNISLAGLGAYARTIPNELLVKIMNHPKQCSEFLDFL